MLPHFTNLMCLGKIVALDPVDSAPLITNEHSHPPVCLNSPITNHHILRQHSHNNLSCLTTYADSSIPTLTNPQSGQSRTAITNCEGLISISTLFARPLHDHGCNRAVYTSGRPSSRAGSKSKKSTQHFQQVGATKETVNVSSASKHIEPVTTELGTVVEHHTVNELPLKGRNLTTLRTLARSQRVNYSQNNTVGDSTGFGALGLRSRASADAGFCIQKGRSPTMASGGCALGLHSLGG